MTELQALASALAVAFVLSLAGVRAIERHASSLGLMDVPNNRSSHLARRPRGGGAGIALGIVAGMAVLAAGPSGFDGKLLGLIAVTLVVAAVGFVDDVRQLGVGSRLLAQTAAAALVVAYWEGFRVLPLPPPFDLRLGWIGDPLAMIWIVGVTNFFNFMDGLDGLAGGQAFVTLLLVAWALWPVSTAVVALVAAAATLAFLLRNWSPARVFLGDVGSMLLGFLLATLPFSATGPTEPLVLLVATSLALFLLDPLATLVRRAYLGRPLGAAHREHAYQRLLRPGAPHGGVVFRLVMAASLLAVLAAVSHTSASLAWLAPIGALIVFFVEWRLAAQVRS